MGRRHGSSVSSLRLKLKAVDVKNLKIENVPVNGQPYTAGAKIKSANQ